MKLAIPEVVILVLIVIVLLSQIEAFSSEVTTVRSDVDGHKYVVLDLPDAEQAADKLARLKAKLLTFVAHLDRKKLPHDIRKKIKRIQKRFKAVLTETKPGSKYTSYTVNKGTKMHMCIRERDENNRLIDENTLFFVALHELAHVMTISIGHKPEFWNNFKYLLRHAIKMGYYKYHPYHTNPQKYCGTDISDTPLKL